MIEWRDVQRTQNAQTPYVLMAGLSADETWRLREAGTVVVGDEGSAKSAQIRETHSRPAATHT